MSHIIFVHGPVCYELCHLSMHWKRLPHLKKITTPWPCLVPLPKEGRDQKATLQLSQVHSTKINQTRHLITWFRWSGHYHLCTIYGSGNLGAGSIVIVTLGLPSPGGGSWPMTNLPLSQVKPVDSPTVWNREGLCIKPYSAIKLTQWLFFMELTWEWSK